MGTRINRKASLKLVGTYIPENEDVFLTICCLAKDTTKANIMRGLLREWMKKQGSEFDILLSIAQIYSHRWSIERRANRNASFGDFKEQVEKQLHKRELSAKQIQRVLVDIVK